MSDNEEYKVGYGKPPEEHQFKKGQSGNPSGRPKRKRMRFAEDISEIFMRSLNEEIEINFGGISRKVTSYEAIILRLKAKALKGNSKALKLYLELAQKAANEEKSHFQDINETIYKLTDALENNSDEEFEKKYGFPKSVGKMMHDSLTESEEERFGL